MNWEIARARIRANVMVGADVNSVDSSWRRVLAVDTPFNRERYGYVNELGFKIRIGKSQSAYVSITWNMLRQCFSQLSASEGYNGAYFRRQYPLQARDHPCHVHVVGQIFVVAGVAYRDGDAYFAFER